MKKKVIVEDIQGNRFEIERDESRILTEEEVKEHLRTCPKINVEEALRNGAMEANEFFRRLESGTLKSTHNMPQIKKRLVIFTGAGISAESGIPTFRDKTNGLWNAFSIEEVATPQAFDENPQRVLDFHNLLKDYIHKASPNHAHRAIKGLESEYDVTVITQNVDDLHERAESKNVVHLHGEITKVTSSRNRLDPRCIKSFPLQVPILIGDKAEDGSQLRPYVVWFGEYLTDTETAKQAIKSADIFVVIGCSMKVFPANSLINYARPEAIKFIINPDKSAGIDGFTHIAESATDGIDTLIALLQNEE